MQEHMQPLILRNFRLAIAMVFTLSGAFPFMKKLLIPAFCLLHMTSLLWWTLPHSFGGMMIANVGQNTLEVQFYKKIMLDDNSWALSFLKQYIDITGSQQYWDFFAPQSPIFHQYLSICNSLIAYPEQGKTVCKGQALFSNLNDDFETFHTLGSGRSRLYRLTENVVNLKEPQLREAFTSYYRTHQGHYIVDSTPVQLVLHQFELHPELKDLPNAGYRVDTVLWVSH